MGGCWKVNFVVGGYFPQRLSKGLTGNEVCGGSGKVEKSLEKEIESKSGSFL